MNTTCFLTRFLYTNEINELAKNNFFLKKFFLGSFPANITPKITSLPCCWIWNTDEQDKSGKHWVAVWLTKKNMFFFDSFAKPISFYSREYWKKLALKRKVQFTYVQSHSVQSKITYTCGSWCLLYLYYQCKNKIEKTNYKIKYNNKVKIKNDINLKNIMLKIFKNKIIEIIQCKNNNNNNNNQKCCNFINLKK